MKEVTNLTTRALTLSDEAGTVLAAAGTPGSVRQFEGIREDDARRLSGMIHVREVEAAPAAAPKKESTAK